MGCIQARGCSKSIDSAKSSEYERCLHGCLNGEESGSGYIQHDAPRGTIHIHAAATATAAADDDDSNNDDVKKRH